MNIKEKPFLDSASRPGPLPGFLFSGPLVAGFFAIFMCAVLGAVGALFLGGWSAWAVEVYDVARFGAALGLAVGAAALLFTAVAAMLSEDRTDRLLFVVGGVATILSLVVADQTVLQSVRDWLTPMRSHLDVDLIAPGNR